MLVSRQKGGYMNIACRDGIKHTPNPYDLQAFDRLFDTPKTAHNKQAYAGGYGNGI